MDVQEFLRKKAIRFDSTHNSRTYIIFDEEQLNFGIFGYFTLSFLRGSRFATGSLMLIFSPCFASSHLFPNKVWKLEKNRIPHLDLMKRIA